MPCGIAVVGGGAAGVELALAIQHRLASELRALGRDPAALAVHLVEAGPEILPTHHRRGAPRAPSRALPRARSPCTSAPRCGASNPGRLYTAAGETIAADEVVWATRARGAPWLAHTGLALDDDGFIRVDATLRSVTDPHVFAAGDVASIAGHRLEKAARLRGAHGAAARREPAPRARRPTRSFATGRNGGSSR
ncbi:MAG: FAD-dependent oxidoreductase [Burkholderiales bacterium]|nr:FAD-dependent oxidoreductase [Burkholderiales bacterium]